MLCVYVADRSWEPECKANFIWKSAARKQVVTSAMSSGPTLRSLARCLTTTSSTEGWQCRPRLCGYGTRGGAGSTTCPANQSTRGMLYGSSLAFYVLSLMFCTLSVLSGLITFSVVGWALVRFVKYLHSSCPTGVPNKHGNGRKWFVIVCGYSYLLSVLSLSFVCIVEHASYFE